MTKEQAIRHQAPILTLKQGDTLIEFRKHAGLAVSGRRSVQGTIEENLFGSLGEGIQQLGGLDLAQAYEGEQVECELGEAAGVDSGDVMVMLQAANGSFAPSRLSNNIRTDPPLVLNGRPFFALPLDDGSWAWFEEPEHYAVIARCTFCEWASRVSGLYSFTVGRMATGHVILHEELDDQGELVTVVRRSMSNSEAVLHWFAHVSWHDAVREVFEAAYREGRQVLKESDLHPDGSVTLEITHELHLAADEQRELWNR